MKYNKIVEEYFFNPTRAGTLDCSNPLTVCSKMGQKKQEMFELYLACDKRGVIENACFKANGNPYLIAALQWLCCQLEGSDLQEHPRLDHSMVMELLEMPKTRYPTALLVEECYKEVIKLMKQKFEEKL